MQLKIIIGIATCKRPNMLSRLVDSLRSADLAGLDASIVVVDNDSAGSAQEVVRNCSGDGWPVIQYEQERRRGISFARNALLAFARARGVRFIAMVDDDIEVTPAWLKTLLSVQRESGAHGVCGRPVYRLETASGPVGEELLKLRNANRGKEVLSTACCLLDREFLDRMGIAFDARFALTGGEDADLFTRIRQAGGTVVYAPEIAVYETVPASRATLGWYMRRMARVTAFYAYRHRCDHGMLRSARRNLPRAAGHVLAGTVHFMLSPLSGIRSRIRGAKKVASAYGLVAGFLGYIPREYRIVHGG